MRKALAILTILAISSGCNALGYNKEAAKKHARKWANEVGLDVGNITCGSSDTDHDGYVSCTFMIDGKPQTYECAGYTLITPHDGCRDPKVKIPRR